MRRESDSVTEPQRESPIASAWRLVVNHLVLPFRKPSPLPESFPVRVRVAIADSERASEVLVCLAQLGATLFFGIVYAITPKAFPAMVPFEPVPWTLAGYAIFTCIRLALALRDRLSPTFLILSAVIDVVVLMVTIWSFHLQYGEPAAIYLKAPTLMYVFILIALRALRFEARYVLVTGLAAVVGWLLLVGYVLAAGDAEITHSFAHYMRSATILIGAEVDKMLSIVMVTLVLAVAVSRARALLVVANSERHAAGELSRFFAPDVASEIRRTDAGLKPGEAVVREAAVMMIDLRGFTRLAEMMAPNDIMMLLGEYHMRMVPAIQGSGGSIDKYLGDGIMATFGATSVHKAPAADALAALEAVLAEGTRWSADLEARGLPAVRIGAAVAFGPMMFGVIGHATRLEFTVTGEAVNLAAKLEKHTKVAACEAIVTREAYERAVASGYVCGMPVVEMAGERVEGVAGAVDVVAFRRSPTGLA